MASANPDKSPTSLAANYEYRISVGDSLNVFVWRNQELSMTVPVRPDGRISLPLVNDIVAIGKTPTKLSEEIGTVLAQYIKQPVVNVIVVDFGVDLENSIKVVGGKLKPVSLPYTENLRVLDVVVTLGGLPDNASGNSAKIIREKDGKNIEIDVDLADLLEDGDMSQNVEMRPGDIVVIPEKWF